MLFSSSSFPLKEIKDSQLQRLGSVLWSWKICEDCSHSKQCTIEETCASQRPKRLVRFFEHYKALTAAYEPDIGTDVGPALHSHEDLFDIIILLKSNPDVTRQQLAETLNAKVLERKPSRQADRQRAINLAVKAMTMVNCSAQRQSSVLLEHAVNAVPWRGDTTFSQFITDIFPITDHPSLNGDDESLSNVKTALAARKLKKHGGLKFQATSDLRSHLKLDRKTGIVEIYHHAAFLKEQLRLTNIEQRNLSVSDSLKLGALPRQLALETLDSLQKILFPLADPKSRSLLRSLISKSSFDPDCLRFESASIRGADEKDIAYHYFGARLADLYEEVENPTPRGRAEKWLERKSGARYVMMATLTGVVIAVMLGMASLGVGGYQAWVGYQQWQHPVRES